MASYRDIKSLRTLDILLDHMDYDFFGIDDFFDLVRKTIPSDSLLTINQISMESDNLNLINVMTALTHFRS